MLTEVKWVRIHNAKLCPLLRKRIFNTYRVKKWIPCFVHRLVKAFKRRFTKVPVIVQLKKDNYYIQQDECKKIMGCKIKHNLHLMNSFATKVNINKIQELAANHSVAKIWYDREVEALLDNATPTVNVPQAWDNNFHGTGIGVAILDTGIYPHPDLTTPYNRIVAFKDFIKNRSEMYDDNGHGTHCAGDAASSGIESDGKYKGPAPKANLIGVKVLNKIGSGAMSDILAGIQWCIENKDEYNIKILSMSLGAKATTSYHDDPLCQAVEKAWDAGIVVCAAAGNEGPEPRTISSPGIDPKIITVGAVNDFNTTGITDDQMASFSSRGPTIDGLTKPDLITPGVNIISLRSPNSYLDKNNKDARVGEWYTTLSGTSMATPICAGIIALLLEKHPNMAPDEVKNHLKSACRDINNLDSNVQGAGLVDAWSALNFSKH